MDLARECLLGVVVAESTRVFMKDFGKGSRPPRNKVSSPSNPTTNYYYSIQN